MKKTLVILLLVVLPVAVCLAQAGERRVALVIGNGTYRHLPRLTNPVKDARDVSETLQALGFSVTTLTDGGISAMEEAVRQFSRELARDSVTAGVFFYAGHAVQSGGENFLIPVDADVKTEVELKRKAIWAQEVLAYMNEARNRFNMVILDACRDNPFAGTFRSATRGLAVVGSAPPETVVVYATAAGSTAEDGAGRNSPFTAALLKHIRTPGIDAEAMLRRVTSEVQATTSNRQTPYRYSSLTSDFQFVTASGSRQPTVTAVVTAVKNTGSVEVSARSAATLHLDGVQVGTVAAGVTVRLDGVETDTHTVELRYDDGERETRSVTVEKDRAVSVTFNYAKRAKVSNGFVLVEAGTFQMGSTGVVSVSMLGDRDEKPDHSVRISRAFYMSNYEVTQKQWREVMGINPSYFKGDDLPVEQVSWYDAVEYFNRLSRREGLTPCYSGSGDSILCNFSANGYRLPTEAEWEYAARGGNQSKGYTHAGSNSVGDVGWYDGNSGGATHPVGRKRPNELGLYDMSGNVWEWCWDWYVAYSSSTATDPVGASGGPDRMNRGGSLRVVRGGSWFDAGRLHVAGRGYGSPSSSSDLLGFRPVRTAE